MPFEDILVAVEEPLGFITLNRPSVLNALRTRLLDAVSYTHLDVYKRQVGIPFFFPNRRAGF